MRRSRRGVLQALLAEGVADTFNAVTVDGDTSTSDTLLAFATGRRRARRAEDRAGERSAAEGLPRGVRAVLANLAEQIARDGEGARKLVEIIVEGAVSKKSARRIALSIANSPLVKTAIAGEDANWGRVVMAVGKAGEPADRDKLVDLVRRHARRAQGRARSCLRRGRGLGLHEEARDRAEGRARHGQGARPRADMRPHQGICGDQRRLSFVIRCSRAGSGHLHCAAVPAAAQADGKEGAGHRPCGDRGRARLRHRRIGMSNRAPTPTAALDQNSAVARKLIEFARQFGVEARDIQTGAVDLAAGLQDRARYRRRDAAGAGRLCARKHGARKSRI